MSLMLMRPITLEAEPYALPPISKQPSAAAADGGGWAGRCRLSTASPCTWCLPPESVGGRTHRAAAGSSSRSPSMPWRRPWGWRGRGGADREGAGGARRERRTRQRRQRRGLAAIPDVTCQPGPVDVLILFTRCQSAGCISIGCCLPTCRLAAMLVARRMRAEAGGGGGGGRLAGGGCTRQREPAGRRTTAVSSAAEHRLDSGENRLEFNISPGPGLTRSNTLCSISILPFCSSMSCAAHGAGCRGLPCDQPTPDGDQP